MLFCKVFVRDKFVANVRVALRKKEKIKGLQGIHKLDEKEGLLIPFDEVSRFKNSIWMFKMKIHIDAIFVDNFLNIVDIKENLKPFSLNPLTWKIYFPKKPCKYVIELKSGVCRKLNLRVGDRVNFYFYQNIQNIS